MKITQLNDRQDIFADDKLSKLHIQFKAILDELKKQGTAPKYNCFNQ